MSRADYLAWLEATEPVRQRQHWQAAQDRRWHAYYVLHPPKPPLTPEEKHARRVAGGKKSQQTVCERFTEEQRFAWLSRAGQASAEKRRRKREEQNNG